MAAFSVVLRRAIPIIAFGFCVATLPRAAAQCTGISEEGRWRNNNNAGDPAFVDVKMMGGCGDTSQNGETQSSVSRYTMRVWVKQSTGKFFGRPAVSAKYQLWKGHKWLRGDIPTGGYVDQTWVLVEQHEGKSQLHMLVRHKSLDSKPDAASEYWFTKTQ